MKTTTIAVSVALMASTLVGCASEETTSTKAFAESMSCETNQGINPLKAALAVAVASEVGRLDPVTDLAVVDDMVTLTDVAKAACAERGFADCPNTQAILSMQKTEVNDFIDQGVFNAVAFREDLKASFDRQSSHENNLSLNNPDLLPGEHETFETGISDLGACGVHYDYNVVGEKVENIEERMAFFGGDNNPFIDFRASAGAIAIDPTGTMNGDEETSSGMCTVGCYAYSTALMGGCCSCNGAIGAFYPAPWNRAMVYCAY